MILKNIDNVFKINSLITAVYLVAQIFFVFILDEKIFSFDIPGVAALENKSLFPVRTANSLTATLLVGLVSLLINIPVVFQLVQIFLKDKSTDNLESLRKKYIVFYYLGYGVLNPYRIWKGFNSRTIKFRMFAIFFYCYMVFMLLYWIFGWDFINIPQHYTLVYLVSSFKFFLYLLNIVVFISLGFFFLTICSGVFLIIYSLFSD
ncbi:MULTISPECIES: hypothetical protein [Neisseria]|uniref:Uncharacterized protein n=1 Tax=Neisseria dumasiana TaxID=1931275 RepID=A0ABX3WKI0_9NEIS|nr:MULTISPECIES: hypothetical protein [Neisseria]OSI33824.1 hypothetical protein BV913_08155 [Neisseria dumasiana]UOO84541.1 hypothetical protein LVJ88_00520 [Neisseria dumasiana]